MEEYKIDSLVTPQETAYFIIMLIISIFFYLILVISVIGIIYAAIIALCLFFVQGLAVGNIRQNSVKITREQFGDIYSKVEEYSNKLNLKKVPDVYLMQSGGLLNAFATRFIFNDIVVIYSDVLEMAYEQGEAAVEFIIAHELAHVKRNHLSKKKYIVLAEIIPYLGLAYSRGCEATCDRIAATITDKLPLDGLMVLTAGKKLYKKVDSKILIANASQEKGFWGWFAEISSTHPSLATRIKYIADMSHTKETNNEFA